MTSRLLTILTTGMAVALLAACGGGSDSEATAPAPAAESDAMPAEGAMDEHESMDMEETAPAESAEPQQ